MVFIGSQFNSAKSKYLLSLFDNANMGKKSETQTKIGVFQSKRKTLDVLGTLFRMNTSI